MLASSMGLKLVKSRHFLFPCNFKHNDATLQLLQRTKVQTVVYLLAKFEGETPIAIRLYALLKLATKQKYHNFNLLYEGIYQVSARLKAGCVVGNTSFSRSREIVALAYKVHEIALKMYGHVKPHFPLHWPNTTLQTGSDHLRLRYTVCSMKYFCSKQLGLDRSR